MTDTHFSAITMIDVCRSLHAKDLLAAADGNVSCRLEEGFLVTPSGRNKGWIGHEDLVTLDREGRPRSGSPSSEIALHLTIYRDCPEAKWVVHAHPPSAIAWSLAHPDAEEIPIEAMPEVILGIGRVPIAPYALPGTQGLAASVEAFLPDSRAILLARHGAVAWGESAEEALNGIERMEHVCRILILAESLGSIQPLEEEQLNALLELRRQMGNTTR